MPLHKLTSKKKKKIKKIKLPAVLNEAEISNLSLSSYPHNRVYFLKLSCQLFFVVDEAE